LNNFFLILNFIRFIKDIIHIFVNNFLIADIISLFFIYFHYCFL